jgi:ABC-type multidrug transport system fused ATPase/permease subunit
MKLWLVILIVLLADAIALAGMLLVRRRSPAGSFVKDAEPASGAINVAGTVLAVLIGFVFLIAFQSYGNARSTSQDEASATSGLFHTAEAFPNADRDRLEGDAICYARAVVNSEFPNLDSGQSSGLVDRWVLQLEHGFERVRVTGLAGSAAEQNWFVQSDARQKARQGRLAEARPLIPTAIWFLLILGGVVVIVFVFAFADIGESKLTQAGMILVVTTVITASLLTIAFLDHPYGNHEGAIGPDAMKSALTSMEREQAARHPLALPCNPAGQPRTPARV